MTTTIHQFLDTGYASNNFRRVSSEGFKISSQFGILRFRGQGPGAHLGLPSALRLRCHADAARDFVVQALRCSKRQGVAFQGHLAAKFALFVSKLFIFPFAFPLLSWT
jgi:hypothetical protein